MTITTPDETRNKIIKAAVRAVCDVVMPDMDFWRKIDDEIIKAFEDRSAQDRKEIAQLWISDGAVAISPYGIDDVIVQKFCIPDVSIPVRKSYISQVEEYMSEVAALRDLATRLNKMADAAEFEFSMLPE